MAAEREREEQSTPAVLVEYADDVATIRFNRPDVLNAVNERLSNEFLAACQSIQSERSIRAVVLRGEGKAFMAGGDLASLRHDPASAATRLIEPLHQALAILASLPLPVIGILHGDVAGAGVGVSLACDLAIAADNTRFSLAYTRVGASLDASTSWHLPRVVGLRKAMELSLLNGTVDAEEAVRLGLVSRVVPLEQLNAEAEKLVASLKCGPTFAYGQVKHLLRGALDQGLVAQLEDEHQRFRECAQSADFAEGVDAFFARRKPMFQG